MRTFDVYRHPEYGYQAVKIGLSWPALFFGLIWLFVKKIWLYAIILTCIQLTLIELSIYFENQEQINISIFIQLIPMVILIIIGFKGNSWLKSSLIRKGYLKLGTVESKSPDSAIMHIVESKYNLK